MTLVTLRPASTSTFTGTVTGAASANAALSDDSDASYITLDGPIGSPPGEAWEGGLTDLTLPAGALIKTVWSRVRVAHSGTPLNMTVFVRPATGALLAFGYAGITWSTPTTFYVGSTSRSGITDADMDGATMYVDNTLPSGTALKVYEAYTDVTYVAQPVVTATAPTATVTDTNLPTVAWSDTLDTDGGAQTFYRVRVFTDAQYLAGGFDAATSTATADTGEVAGTATSWQVTSVLPDDTYRAYVAVAQTVNGVVSWSSYAFTEFTISVALSGTPTLVATADNTNARIALVITDNVGTASTDQFELQRSTDGSTWEAVRTLDGDGMLDAPYVAATGTFSDSADGLTHALALPSPSGGIVANDMLIAFVAMDGTPTLSWPSGWTEIKDEAGNASAVRVGCAWKRAVGGESGTVTLTTSASEGGGGQILCVRNAHTSTAPEVSTGVSGAGANGDPDALNPANWGTENTLWIAAVGNDGNVAVTAGPSGYFDFLNTRWANASGAGIATASKLAVAASQDPGAFTHTAEDTRAFTVAVRPRNDVLTAYDYEAPNGTTMSYRARSLHDYNGVWAASAWATDTEAWSSTSWWLKHPNRPDLNVAVTVRSLPSIVRAGRQGKFQPLGAAYAVVVTDTRDPGVGQVTLRTLSLSDQADLDALLDEVATLLLQSPAGQGGPGYVKIGNHDRRRIIDYYDASRVWDTLDFAVVESPPGAVVAWS